MTRLPPPTIPPVADLYGELLLAETGTQSRRLADFWPGVAVVGAAALAAAWIADHYAAPLVLMGLLIGLSLSFVSQDKRTHAGLDLMSQTALRIGIVLLGARITLDQFAALGLAPFAALVVIMLLVVIVTIASARLFGQSRHAALLAGGATAICGASAALALYGLIGKQAVDQSRFTLTLVGITVASALAMSLYPVLAVNLGLSDAQAGFLIGASIHDVAQAIGGGFSVSVEAGETATIVKLTRVALLAPMLMLAALWLARADGVGTSTRGRVSLRLPWFITAFLAVVVAGSILPIPAAVASGAGVAAQALLLLAIVATAMKAQLHLLLGQGWRSFAPVAVATFTSFLASLGAALAL